jgi:hypothetical protein
MIKYIIKHHPYKKLEGTENDDDYYDDDYW